MLLARYQYHYRKPRRRRPSLSRIVMFLILLLVIAYPFYEAYHLTIDYHNAVIADLPRNLKNLKIVYLSDIHESARYPQAMVNDLIRTVNGLSADLVLFGGDYADDSTGAIDFFKNLPKVQARLGVYGVVGNHDRTEPETNFALLAKAMNASGVQLLSNAVTRIRLGDASLYIAGVDDYYNGYPDVAGVAAQVKQDDFVIFLGHTPDLMPDALKAVGSDGDNHWFDLALFGHTHGGQLTLLGIPLLPQYVPDIGTRYLSGWLEENRAKVLVSNGVGTGIFPARLFTPSQIHLITLKAEST